MVSSEVWAVPYITEKQMKVPEINRRTDLREYLFLVPSLVFKQCAESDILIYTLLTSLHPQHTPQYGVYGSTNPTSTSSSTPSSQFTIKLKKIYINFWTPKHGARPQEQVHIASLSIIIILFW